MQWPNEFGLSAMSMLLSIGAIVLGAIFASFLTVIVDRVPSKRNIGGRSACPSCRAQLRWLDLIPIYSYVRLRGRCRECGVGIPRWYLWLEIGLPLLWLALVLTEPTLDLTGWLHLTFRILVMTGVVTFAMTDLLSGLLPNRLLIAFTLISLPWWIWFVISGQVSIIQLLIGLGVAGGLIAALHLVSRGKAMGAGDVKYAALLGLWFGWPSIALVLYLSFVAGLLIAIGLLIARRKKKTDTVPFGSILSLGAIIVLIWYQPLFDLMSRWLGW